MQTSDPHDSVLRRLIDRSHDRRMTLAGALMPFIFSIPLLAIEWVGNYASNIFASWFLFAFSLLLAPEAVLEMRRTRWSVVLAIAFSACLLFWLIRGGDYWFNGQFSLYVAATLFYFSARAWLRQGSLLRTAWTFGFKVSTVLATSGVFLIGFLADGQGRWAAAELISNAPIYGHIRQFSVDLLLAICMAVWLLGRAQGKAAHILLFGALTLFGFMSAWTAGRGGMAGAAVFLGALAASRSVPFSDRRLLGAAAALLLGVGLVFLTGNDGYLTGRMQTFVDGADVSTGRLQIWEQSLQFWMNAPPGSVLFGLGPNSIWALRATHTITVPGINLMHPHSVLVQWLMDFGLVGGLMLILKWSLILLRSLHGLALRALTWDQAVLLGTVVSLFSYALVEGIFYQSTSLISMVFILAAARASKALP